MAVLTVRNVPDHVHRALRARAVRHGHSTAAEVRAILAAAVESDKRVFFGDELASLGRKIVLTDEDFATFDRLHDKKPAEPPR